MDMNGRWMQMEGQLVQLTGEVRERRAKVRRLQEALDETRAELGRIDRDLGRLREDAPGGGAGTERPAVGMLWLAQGQAQHVEALETVCEQLRELVALHRVFRELARLLREVTGEHEARIRVLEGRLPSGRHSRVH